MTKRKTQRVKGGRRTDKDGYKSKKKVPRKKQPPSELLDGKSQPLISQAISQGWLDDGNRWETEIRLADLQKRAKTNGLTGKERMILACLTDGGGDDPKYRQAAVANFIKMEAQNQADQHLVIQTATPELHVHGHRHDHTGSDGTDTATILAALDSELTRRGLRPDDTSANPPPPITT